MYMDFSFAIKDFDEIQDFINSLNGRNISYLVGGKLFFDTDYSINDCIDTSIEDVLRTRCGFEISFLYKKEQSNPQLFIKELKRQHPNLNIYNVRCEEAYLKYYWLYKHQICNLATLIIDNPCDDIVVITQDGFMETYTGYVGMYPKYYNHKLISEHMSNASTTVRFCFEKYPEKHYYQTDILFDSDSMLYYVQYENCLVLKNTHEEKILRFYRESLEDKYFTTLITNKHFQDYMHIFDKYDLCEVNAQLQDWIHDDESLFLLND